jgi:hypothetical protein
LVSLRNLEPVRPAERNLGAAPAGDGTRAARWWSLLHGAFPFALLLGVLLAFFSPTILHGEALAPTDITLANPLFRGLAPAGFTAPHNSRLFDQANQFVPWRYFAWSSLRNGQSPWWNPYSSTGTPFVATMQSAVFYPINLILLGVPFATTLLWSAVIQLWIAGSFTYTSPTWRCTNRRS